MLYDISARIRYDYDPPAAAGRNLLRLMPADLPGRQRLVAGQVTALPAPDERTDRTDFFGNAVVETVHRAPARTTEFVLRARVDRLASGPEMDLSPPLPLLGPEIAGVADLSAGAPHHFLGSSPRVPVAAAIADFAREATEGAGSVRAAVEALGRALHGAMTFDATATTVDTPAAEAFAARRGVCQDFAHVMIAGLRALGVPAAYVSGFLRTDPPPGRPRLEGADAMHAWVRAWCGWRAGWVDYDPTNACPAGEAHVQVAVGRDYDDVAPVQGVLRTSGGQHSRQAVDVHPVETRPSGP